MRKQTTLIAGLAAASLTLTACGGVSTSNGDDAGGDYPSGTVEMYVGSSAGGSSKPSCDDWGASDGGSWSPSLAGSCAVPDDPVSSPAVPIC